MNVDARLRELGIELPPAPTALAAYVPVVVAGGFAFVAGQVPLDAGAVTTAGKLGRDVDVEAGASAARRCALQALSALQAELGSLDRVRRVVRVVVYVASAEGFADQPKVANGASELLVDVFGDGGRHARAAVGVAELPLGAAVEVELMVELNA